MSAEREYDRGDIGTALLIGFVGGIYMTVIIFICVFTATGAL